MKQIKDIIPEVIQGIQPPRSDVHTKIQTFWRGINNGAFARHSLVIGLKERRLIVHVDSPAWLFQLRLQKKEIIEQIRTQMPEVSDIHFKLGKVK